MITPCMRVSAPHQRVVYDNPIHRELSLQQEGPLAGRELVINPINETQVLPSP